MLTKDKSGLSEILYALRISEKKDGKSTFEKQLGREPNTVKSNVVGKLLDVSEEDPNLELRQSFFQTRLSLYEKEHGAHSFIAGWTVRQESSQGHKRNRTYNNSAPRQGDKNKSVRKTRFRKRIKRTIGSF